MPTTLPRRDFLGGLALATALAVPGGSILAATERRFFSRIGKPIGLQLYTLGIAPTDDPRPALAELARIGYREIELPGLYKPSPTELRAAADALGLRFTSMHVPLDPTPWDPNGLTLGGSAQATADVVGTLGISEIVVPMMPLPPLTGVKKPEDIPAAIARALAAAGVEFWQRLAARINEKAAALKPLGITLGYHNHNLEFAPLGDTTGWDILVKEFDPALVKFELDIGWLATAGQDPSALLRRLTGRVQWVHVKDVAKGAPTNFALSTKSTEVGYGSLDWPKILKAAADSGVQRYFVEQEPPFATTRIAAVEKSFRYLSRLRA